MNVCSALVCSVRGGVGNASRWRTETIEDSTNGTIPQADDDPDLWRRIRAEVSIGHSVTGTVICRRPFGVFLDIGYGASAPAVLLVTEFADDCIKFDDYALGDSVTALVANIVWDQHKIALTQNRRLNGDTGTWVRV